MVDLQELEAIKRLKHKYVRCVDQKLWDELKECFTQDATCAFNDGKYVFSGRDEIVKFLVQAMGRPTIVSSHQVHQPEIDITGDTTAMGIWALADTVIDREEKWVLHGAAFYADEYEKVDGQWRIKRTGYKRTFEEVEPLKDTSQERG